MKPWFRVTLCLVGLTAAAAAQPSPAVGAPVAQDKAALLAANDLILARPNLQPAQAMPLGNGSLGIAVWSADGLTVQLNRADTMPNRLSPGQVIVPGLARLTSAADYKGRLDLYNGEFVESGNGISAHIFVEPARDVVVIALTGLPANTPQTALLTLWPPRAPRASATARYGVLAESWRDEGRPGASGLPFGSLAAISAIGRDLHVAVKDPRTVALTVTPDAHGRLTLLIAAPAYNGSRPPSGVLAGAFTSRSLATHRAWWHAYWNRADLIQAASADGEAQYMANLRDLYLFYAAAERGTAWPGSQAGIADMLSAVRDAHMWDPSAFWHWNLRMMTAANLGAGLPELNASYFNLYRNALPGIETWTRQHMQERPGICVPETMRFNGPGIEYETWTAPAKDCAADSPPYYNARTLSTGAEISFWIWQQYLQTGDLAFLWQNYPVMRAAARFLLAYQKPGSDGLLHTAPSNAHETQWDVTDPITDLVGIRTLYTNTAQVAQLLHTDAALAAQMRAALTRLPPLPRTTAGKPTVLLPPGADAAGRDVLTTSSMPQAPQQNVENLGLEPVWPYGLIGSDSPQAALAIRTFHFRPYPLNQDWSSDPIQAARLGLAADVAGTLAKLTEHYQVYPNGLASWGGHSGEFYIEQSGVVAAALSEALAQDYDGTLRIAPAVPDGWTMAGSIALRHRATVSVRVEQGTVRSALLAIRTTGDMRLKNPWGSTPFTITDAATGKDLATGSGPLTFTALGGHRYQLHPAAEKPVPYAPLAEPAATQLRRLGTRTLGLP